MGLRQDFTDQLFGSASTRTPSSGVHINIHKSRKFPRVTVRACVDRTNIGNSDLQKQIVDTIEHARNGEDISINTLKRVLDKFAESYTKEPIAHLMKRVVQQFVLELERRDSEKK